MLSQERRQRVLEIVKDRGFIALDALATQVEASESTVRRDLDYWHDLGAIQRTHGGAMVMGTLGKHQPVVLPALDDRADKAIEEKRRIAEVAAKRIADGSSILIDGGTTTLELAKLLVGRPLQVVTNSVPIAAILSQSRLTEVMLLGGIVFPRTGVALGPTTVSQLASIHVNQAILSVHGISPKGLFNHHQLLVETELAIIRCADEVVVLADHTKLGQTALCQLCPLTTVDTVICDDGASPEAIEWLTAAGPRILLAGKNGVVQTKEEFRP